MRYVRQLMLVTRAFRTPNGPQICQSDALGCGICACSVTVFQDERLRFFPTLKEKKNSGTVDQRALNLEILGKYETKSRSMMPKFETKIPESERKSREFSDNACFIFNRKFFERNCHVIYFTKRSSNNRSATFFVRNLFLPISRAFQNISIKLLRNANRLCGKSLLNCCISRMQQEKRFIISIL